MAIADADIVMYPAAVQNDTTSNGGRIDDSTVIPDNTRNNLFPLRESSYLTAGGIRYRKLFFRTEDNTQYATAIKHWLSDITAAGDQAYLVGSSVNPDTDTQGDITGNNLYGAGRLDAGVSAGATSIDVNAESTTTIFRNGDEIRIDDGTNYEYATISGAPSLAGTVWTLTLSAGLANSYSALTIGPGGENIYTIVSNVLTVGDRQPGVSGSSVTSASGTFDGAQVTVQPDGAIPDQITITFTDATNFTAAGVAAGSLGSGAVGSTFAPTNPNTGTAYFSIPTAAWGGTFAAADTVIFDVDAAVWAVWIQLTTPAGMASLNPNVAGVRYSLEAVVI